jgi:hypothetical protein
MKCYKKFMKKKSIKIDGQIKPSKKEKKESTKERKERIYNYLLRK